MSASVRRAWVEQVLQVQFAGVGTGAQPSQGAANDQTANGAAPGAEKGPAVRLAQAMLQWNNMRSYVRQQVKQLQDTILEATSSMPEYASIKDNIGNLEAPLQVLDDSLTVKLNELRTAADDAAKQKLSAEARAVVAKFQKFVAEDRLMNDIDGNGFLPLDIKARVSATLDDVMKTI